jgi:hypothetical protein
LTVAVLVAIGRLVLLIGNIGPGASVMTWATVVTVLAVLVAAFVVPVQIARARSVEQIASVQRQNPGAIVIGAARSPLGKHDYVWVSKNAHLNLFYSIVATRQGIEIWQGGRHASRLLKVDRSQISASGTTNLQQGSRQFPAVQLTFITGNAGSGVTTAAFFVRRPSRPMYPARLENVEFARSQLAGALGA